MITAKEARRKMEGTAAGALSAEKFPNERDVICTAIAVASSKGRGHLRYHKKLEAETRSWLELNGYQVINMGIFAFDPELDWYLILWDEASL